MGATATVDATTLSRSAGTAEDACLRFLEPGLLIGALDGERKSTGTDAAEHQHLK